MGIKEALISRRSVHPHTIAYYAILDQRITVGPGGYSCLVSGHDAGSAREYCTQQHITNIRTAGICRFDSFSASQDLYRCRGI